MIASLLAGMVISAQPPWLVRAVTFNEATSQIGALAALNCAKSADDAVLASTLLLQAGWRELNPTATPVVGWTPPKNCATKITDASAARRLIVEGGGAAADRTNPAPPVP